VSERFGKQVSADNVMTLVEKSLWPDGLVATADGSQPRIRKRDPLLALKMKVTLLPESVVRVIATALRPLFWPPVVVAVLVALVALDIWYFGIHGIGQSLRDLIYQPLIVLLVYGLLIVSIGWHELGHAAACRYGGAQPGRIGFGIYIVWPAFFADVTEALTLGKGGRVRTDLGGLFFNGIFCLLIGGVYWLTGFEPILVLIVMQHLLILYNLMPFLRLDGYHAVSDLTGIPDLFGRIKPTLEGVAPWKETPDEVYELKRWARVVVTTWVLLVVPVLFYFFGMMVLSAPRVIATGWDSLLIQWDKISGALSDGQVAKAGVGGIQAAMIVLPASGMALSFSRIGKRIAMGFWKSTAQRPVMRTCVGLLGAAAIAAGIYVLIPNGDYRPIQPNERWTFAEGLEAASQISSGRPSLTEVRETDLGGAPALHETGGDFTPAANNGGGGSTSTEGTGEVDRSDESTTSEGGTADAPDTEEPEPTPSPTESDPEPTPTPSPTASE
jgi:putative peptide zinc metalloprotease protein